ncbi:MAG: hypothetical protein DCF15_00250 [Phormidesmis priestleyi]|uniref:Uncharacterized protein n=1 Tax=Phormidesmis priestleyi TaxID=268141 RepID=A0A2W4XY02_9CYAN|nr:MAG: hypothetical protein DCF15_00250 [Phormidesmis priestleyi]
MSPKNVLVKCPQCQRLYIDWLVAAINIEPETLFKTTDTSAANVGPSTICSKCGHRAQVSDLCDRDGVLQQID